MQVTTSLLMQPAGYGVDGVSKIILPGTFEEALHRFHFV
jgi:hypothetical protein